MAAGEDASGDVDLEAARKRRGSESDVHSPIDSYEAGRRALNSLNKEPSEWAGYPAPRGNHGRECASRRGLENSSNCEPARG